MLRGCAPGSDDAGDLRIAELDDPADLSPVGGHHPCLVRGVAFER